MSTYLKNMDGYKHTQLKNKSFKEIQMLFEKEMKRVNIFVDMDAELVKGSETKESEVDRAVPKLAAGSSKRAAKEELDQESSKRQKTGESSELAEELRVKEADELSQVELQQIDNIFPEQGMNIEALQTKYPIIDWEIYTEGTRKYWKIIRVRNHTEVHHFFDDILKAFNKDDLVMLWSLVKEKFNSIEPTYDKERKIWVELKRLFEPDTDDELWKFQKHIHDLTWRLYDSCGVHHVSTKKGIDIYMLIMRCPENFLGRYSCRLKDQEDKVFGYILLVKIKLLIKKLKDSEVGINKPPLTFDELMHTPIDFTAFAMNPLQIDNLTKADLVGPVYNLLKGTCKSYVELDFTMEECYRALSEQLD
ncbi:hypothetical protein Tco_0134674 [Tanacetum coccineum]